MNLLLLESAVPETVLPAGDPRERHLRSVLRAQTGDTLRVGVPRGPTGIATIASRGPEGVQLRCRWQQPPSRPLPVDVVLGHPRPPVLRRLWRDLTAMRVRSIRVFVGALSEKSYLDSSAWDQSEAAVYDGLSQGMHTAVPEITRHATLATALDAHRWDLSGSIRWFGRMGVQNPSLLTAAGAAASGAVEGVTIAVGPERGFTPQEEELLQRHRFHGVSLGTSVLRTETATILLAGVAAELFSEGRQETLRSTPTDTILTPTPNSEDGVR